MRGLILSSVLLMSGCSATLVESEGQIHTIGKNTGRLMKGGYTTAFESTARETCPEGYKVLQRSPTPYTLKENKLLEAYDFYWVIECQGGEK